jgi:hypothetical protein
LSPSFKIIYLLGAGFSVPAGLDDITKITDDFFSESNLASMDKIQKRDIVILKEVTSSYFQSNYDIESFLTIIQKLEDHNDDKLLKAKYKKVSKISSESLRNINLTTQAHIRKRLEENVDIEPLKKIICLGNEIHIFTLNYDAVIDIICETYGVSYVDGFDLFWDSTLLGNLDSKIKLYRLHGSLYWFRLSNGKSLKVPLKGLVMDNLKDLYGNPILEMIIYPTIKKEKYSYIYSWLNTRFIEFLERSNLCIVVGYSFRDHDILNNIENSLKINLNLFILIISPKAVNSKDILVKKLPSEIYSRIGWINGYIENLFEKLIDITAHFPDYLRLEEEIEEKISERNVSDLKNYPQHNYQIEYLIDNFIKSGFNYRAHDILVKFHHTLNNDTITRLESKITSLNESYIL